MTIYEKLFQYYPHHRAGFQYEFDCITQDDTEVKRHQTLCKIDSGFEFKEPEGGGDYTTKSIKPTTDDANKEPKIGMSYERVYDPPYALLQEQDDFRRVWIGIMLKLVYEDMAMTTPIFINQYVEKGCIKTIGYVYATKQENLI